jgi:hypothetical protein
LSSRRLVPPHGRHSRFQARRATLPAQFDGVEFSDDVQGVKRLSDETEEGSEPRMPGNCPVIRCHDIVFGLPEESLPGDFWLVR